MQDVYVHDVVDAGGLERLRAIAGVRVTVAETAVQPETWVVPEEHAGRVNVLLTSYAPANLPALSALGLIQISSAGYTQLVGLGLPEAGIRASNARGIFDVPIAEWNVAMIVNLARDLRGMIRNQEGGIWDRSARYQHEVRGAVVGIWGYGGIGRETARLCKTMGMRVHVLSRTGIAPRTNVYCVPGTGDPRGVLPDRVFLPEQKLDFLHELDFLLISMPLTEHTRGIVGEAELQALPARAHVLNPARGPIIQEEALLRALREGWIAGAALDTHYIYPMPPDHPLWALPNVIMTPHVSGSTLSPHFKERLWEILVENVTRLMAGEPLLNELTVQQLRGG
ncbi:MAG: D-2-hydroxyacid dehydrogenase [Anaerolineae bacterium]|nr:D-2-hydroxyacid dehydrogenase [Anaerolineae bacterium]